MIRLSLKPVSLSLFFLLAVSSAQQGNQEISRKEKELERLRHEIQMYEKKIQEAEKKERTTLDHLDNLERQSNLIRKLIRSLRQEEQRITVEIKDSKSSISDLERQLRSLKDHYARYIQSVYKHGRVYDLELLFSSNSINQLLIRIEYLKRFSDQRAKDLQAIVTKKLDLEEQNAQLQSSLDRERAVLAEKTKEESALKAKMKERQRVLVSIRKDRKTYVQELSRRNEAARQIEKTIAALVEKERLKKEREAAAARERERLAKGPSLPPELSPVSTFGQHRGRLRWPVSTGSIASRFGNQIHPILKTVTQNTGIDITVPIGSDVSAVADGEVSVLSFIPGFGNILILNHYEGYRTVYAHLSDISVAESQKVSAGEVIAKSGDSIGGPVLHFEIWKEREKQNPELWLARPQ